MSHIVLLQNDHTIIIIINIKIMPIQRDFIRKSATPL